MGAIQSDLIRCMNAKIQGLFKSKAALAQLRRGIGKEIGDIPGILGFILPAENITSWAIEEEQIEKAMYAALTLYAFHQQGNSECVSTGLEDEETISHKNSFGHAIRKLVKGDENKEIAVTRRFDKVLTAKDLTELAIHARGLIGLLKKEKMTLDYPSFAVDLYWFQKQDSNRKVLLKWGKDYYMSQRKEEEK